MTVCIAAISLDHSIVSFATDRMVTANFPPIQFEHTIPKIIPVNNRCVALTAGNAIMNKEVLEIACQAVRGKDPTTAEVAAQVANAYQRKRLEMLTAHQLSARGISHQDFLTHGARILPDHVYADIDRAFATASLEVDILLAGVDDGGASIYAITNPGVANSYNSIGFHAIGTGGMHAMISLIEMYNPKFDGLHLTYSVYRAKRTAEIAPGVGQRTDLGIITREHGVGYIEEKTDLFGQFADIYSNESRIRKELTQSPQFTKLKLSTAQPMTNAQSVETTEKGKDDGTGH